MIEGFPQHGLHAGVLIGRTGTLQDRLETAGLFSWAYSFTGRDSKESKHQFKYIWDQSFLAAIHHNLQ